MLGIDVVDLDRFRRTLARSPGLACRFFSADELAYCERHPDPVLHLAGTFAAKEATMKAISLTPAVAAARRIRIERGSDGRPVARVGQREIAISISHDGAVTVAVALAV